MIRVSREGKVCKESFENQPKKEKKIGRKNIFFIRFFGPSEKKSAGKKHYLKKSEKMAQIRGYNPQKRLIIMIIIIIIIMIILLRLLRF